MGVPSLNPWDLWFIGYQTTAYKAFKTMKFKTNSQTYYHVVFFFIFDERIRSGADQVNILEKKIAIKQIAKIIPSWWG